MSQTAERTYQIIHDMLPDLPALVGPDEWPALAAELARLDAAWATADAARRMGLGAAYRSLLAPYAAARERLAAALRDAEQDDDVLLGVAALLEQAGDATGAAALRQAAEQRKFSGLKVGQEAQSFKWDNREFTFWNVSAAIGSILATIAAATAADTQPLALAGAILLLIAALAKPFVREVDADDTSVFLGLARAAGRDGTAALADIVVATNGARNNGRLRLGVLTKEEVEQALSRLSVMKSVAPAEGDGERWQVIEEHGAV